MTESPKSPPPQIPTKIKQLKLIREDVDAIDHHQSDRLVRELDDIINALTVVSWYKKTDRAS